MSRLRRLLVAAILGVVAVALLPALPAAAHGNVTSPASRNYGCWERWGSRFQDPAMATQDPMCWQAWQADVQAMWNWNGLYREGVGGNHQAAISDGELCSAGRTQNGRYAAMDRVGDWTATPTGTSFNVRVFDQASHGADYIRVYVSKAGYDPRTEPLGWDDLELVAQIGNRPASQWTPVTGGVQLELPVSLPGRTGRAVVYTIWQASHLDQSYYWCSDIAFDGSSTPTDPDPDPDPDPSPSGDCTATYAVTSQWQGGFQAAVTVTAGAEAIRGWNVHLHYTAAQAVQQAWNATVTTSGTVVSATNAAYNGALRSGGTATFGFIGTGTPTPPTLMCMATL